MRLCNTTSGPGEVGLKYVSVGTTHSIDGNRPVGQNTEGELFGGQNNIRGGIVQDRENTKGELCVIIYVTFLGQILRFT